MNLRHPRQINLRAAAFLLIAFGPPASRLTAAPAAASPAPTASPAAVATTPVPAADYAAPPKYDGTQQSQYISTANTAFTAERKVKFQAFIDARNAFQGAGGINTKGLTDKASVIARRDLLAKLRVASDDYLAFITTEEQTYRAELAKTPLVAGDVDSLVARFVVNENIPRAVKTQQDEKDLLSCSDEMLGSLEKWDGQWSLSSADKLTFKRKSDHAAYAALEQKYNGIVKEYLQDVQAQQKPTPTPGPAAETPAASAAP